MAKCDACGHWYYLRDNPNVGTEEEQSRYWHRIVRKGTPDEHYACKPKDTSSVPIPDK